MGAAGLDPWLGRRDGLRAIIDRVGRRMVRPASWRCPHVSGVTTDFFDRSLTDDVSPQRTSR